MLVSVVICTYADERYGDFREAAESVLTQSYDAVELVVVVDGNERVAARAREEFGDHEDVVVHCNEGNRGLSYSRTRGVEYASGDVIAFLDDDAIAQPDWVEQLVTGYEKTDAIAVGGRMVPEWVTGEPSHIPEEFYWLIGANYEGRLDAWSEVRNTLGSNISFRRTVFEEVGGFDEQVGLQGEKQIQAEETELCIRMYETFGKGVLYNPNAVVAHKIFDYRTQTGWLLRRAFWQGYSKRALETLGGDGPENAEADFLRHLACESVPGRIRRLLGSPSLAAVQQLSLIFLLTFSVGLGYLYGFITGVGQRTGECEQL